MADAIDAAVATETDDALVARARDGDQRAFADLVRRHRQPVVRLVASILGHGFEAEAEEVTQEVFVRVYESLASFRGDAKFGSWLYRIAFNQALNLKARVRHRSPHVTSGHLGWTDALGRDRLAADARGIGNPDRVRGHGLPALCHPGVEGGIRLVNGAAGQVSTVATRRARR